MAIVLPKIPAGRDASRGKRRNQPVISIQFDREDGVYAPGDLLECRWKISRVALPELRSAEASIMWHTEGKGDEDLAVHKFQRIPGKQLQELGESYEHALVTELPRSPLSYDGHLLRIRWCMRVRLAMANEDDALVQAPFFLGYAD